MKWTSELRPIGFSVGFLVIGVVVLRLSKPVVSGRGDIVFVTLLLIPPLVYLAVSGRLESLKGPGGLELRLARVAQRAVTPVGVIKSVTADFIPKGGFSELREVENKVSSGTADTTPTVLTMIVGSRVAEYDSRMVLEYLDVLARLRNLKLVVFVDVQGKFVAYMSPRAIRGILETPSLATGFLAAVNGNNPDRLKRYAGVITSAISTTATNVRALRKMERLRLESLLVVRNNIPKGIVERETIITDMVLALANATAGSAV